MTGTLTQNRMTVIEHYGPVDTLAAAMTLCCDAVYSPDGAQGEPTEAALVNFGAANGQIKPELENEQPRVAAAAGVLGCCAAAVRGSLDQVGSYGCFYHPGHTFV